MLKRDRVEELLRMKFGYEEMAKILNSTPEAVRKYVSRNLKHVTEELEETKLKEIEKYYKDGYTSREIGKKLGIPSSTVKNYMAEQLRDKKEIHDINYKKRVMEKNNIKKEDERLLRKENDAFMSVGEFVKRNINCYDQVNGSYVFNGKSGLPTWDTPIKYTPNI